MPVGSRGAQMAKRALLLRFVTLAVLMAVASCSMTIPAKAAVGLDPHLPPFDLS